VPEVFSQVITTIYQNAFVNKAGKSGAADTDGLINGKKVKLGGDDGGKKDKCC
jgi:hypothetical protein